MINRVVLVGRLTSEPIIRKSQSGTSLANFTIAVNRTRKVDGQPDADFINCVSFGNSAEFMEQYIKKGYLVGVDGRIQTRNYENQQGHKVYVTEIVCDSVQNYQPKDNSSYTESNNSHSEEWNSTLGIQSDDLPF